MARGALLDPNTAPVAEVTEFNVMIRHSPFLLKNLDVKAKDEDEAKAKFLAAADEKHKLRETRIDNQAGLDSETKLQTKRAIRAAYDRGLDANRKNELTWVIRPAAEVKAERKEIERLQQETLKR